MRTQLQLDREIAQSQIDAARLLREQVRHAERMFVINFLVLLVFAAVMFGAVWALVGK